MLWISLALLDELPSPLGVGAWAVVYASFVAPY